MSSHHCYIIVASCVITGVGGLQTVTIEELMDHTQVTDAQLDTEIEDIQLYMLAAHFDDYSTYPLVLGLNASEQQDVRTAAVLHNTQTAMFEALRLWKKLNPDGATFRALVEIVLGMGKQDLALHICTVCGEVRIHLNLRWNSLSDLQSTLTN